MQVSETFLPQKGQHVMEYEVEGEVALYDPRRDHVHILNSTAAVVWRLCDGSRTVEQLVEDVALLFNGELSMVDEDVKKLLEQLRQSRLVQEEAAVS